MINGNHNTISNTTNHNNMLYDCCYDTYNYSDNDWISLSLSSYIYIYVHTYIHTYMYTYMYIYIYICIYT